MQYHLNGYRSADPTFSEAADGAGGPMPETVDVLIVGSGPAGLTLATQLARFPDINTRIIERRPGPLEVGQADGVACRSMEMFEALGFAERVLRESYWVNETVFWRPDPDNPNEITRVNRIQDVADDLSEMPHVILNQARVHEFFLDEMRMSPRRLVPDYNHQLLALEIDEAADSDYPVSATLEQTDPGQATVTKTVRARYVVGCDGARSRVRQSLGYSLVGDSANVAWGVMDVLAVTDFPDIRLKSAIQSSTEGSILIIPREGGYLVRLYTEMATLASGERASDRAITADQIIATAQRIFRPYTLEVKEVAWWSVYEIGQRVCKAFDNVPPNHRDTRMPRVFIAGDACHTHSPKAGQGMNVSMADAFNLGWKLAAVLRGHGRPELLRSYSDERQLIANELIEFDRDMARLISGRAKAGANASSSSDGSSVSPEEFQRYFIKHGRYTAGVEARYATSAITGDDAHQRLAAGQIIGKRFHSAPVIRLADAKPMQLGHAIKADGRWRVMVFAGRNDHGQESGDVAKLCSFWSTSVESPARRHTPAGQDPDSIIELLAIFQDKHRELDLTAMPGALMPRKGRYGLIDYEKMFCPDHKAGIDIFEVRGIDRSSGVLLIIRPDQFVAAVLPIDNFAEMTRFFSRVLVAV